MPQFCQDIEKDGVRIYAARERKKASDYDDYFTLTEADVLKLVGETDEFVAAINEFHEKILKREE